MGVNFGALLKAGRKAVGKTKGKNIKKVAGLALAAARLTLKKAKVKPKTPRVIRVPKIGGVLPLVPIFAGLSAIGSFINNSYKQQYHCNSPNYFNFIFRCIAVAEH